jgi:hypothetical protein
VPKTPPAAIRSAARGRADRLGATVQDAVVAQDAVRLVASAAVALELGVDPGCLHRIERRPVGEGVTR